MLTKSFIQPALKTLLAQLGFAGIFFFGMLLDPLVGLWLALFYFLGVGSFFIYKYFE